MAENQDTASTLSDSGRQPDSDASDARRETTDVTEAIRKLSDKNPEVVEQFIAMGMGTIGNPLHQKMNEGHISTVLDLAVRHDEREFELAKGHQNIQSSNRWFALVVFAILVGTVVLLVFTFKDKPDALIPLITGIFGFGSGFGGGFGYAKSKSS